MKISKTSILSMMKLIIEKTEFKSESMGEDSIEFNALYTNEVDISEILNSEYKLPVDEIKSGLFVLNTLGLISLESVGDKTYKSVTLTKNGYSFYLNSLFANSDQ